MTPDLSKLKVGSRVTFVADAEDVSNIARNFTNNFIIPIRAKQIISIEPPAFDWAEARPGMRFKDIEGKYFWYVGPDISDNTCVVGSRCKDIILSEDLLVEYKSDLTPAPEDEG